MVIDQAAFCKLFFWMLFPVSLRITKKQWSYPTFIMPDPSEKYSAALMHFKDFTTFKTSYCRNVTVPGIIVLLYF